MCSCHYILSLLVAIHQISMRNVVIEPRSWAAWLQKLGILVRCYVSECPVLRINVTVKTSQEKLYILMLLLYKVIYMDKYTSPQIYDEVTNTSRNRIFSTIQ
jgi:hypothetical protein